ncbi:MAG: hypothetical protein ABFR97_03225 [Thermodesulfobacteriota bacterium]
MEREKITFYQEGEIDPLAGGFFSLSGWLALRHDETCGNEKGAYVVCYGWGVKLLVAPGLSSPAPGAKWLWVSHISL